MSSIRLATLLDAFEQVVYRFSSESLQCDDLVGEVLEMIEVGIFLDPSLIDEGGDGLFGDAVDVESILAHETSEFLQLLGGTVGIGAMQRLRATLAFDDVGWSVAHRTSLWYLQDADALCYLDDFRNNLVGLDDLQLGALSTDAQSLTLADVAE